MRRFLLLLLFVPCALLHAYDVEVDGVYYNIVGTSMAHVTHKGSYNNVEYNSYTGDIVILRKYSETG